MGALKPVRFRVTNYRNINDSGWVELAQVTALVGRNESGKTALLKALHKFNPPTAQKYHPQREFPRDRFTREFKDGKDWRVCAVEFEIDDTLRPELLKVTGGAEGPLSAQEECARGGNVGVLLSRSSINPVSS
jgi:energy-coupling factor transporter ATP-binding protein EcfA2